MSDLIGIFKDNPFLCTGILAGYGIHVFAFFKASTAARKKIAGGGLVVFLTFVLYWAYRYRVVDQMSIRSGDDLFSGLLVQAVAMSAAIFWMWVGGIGAAISLILLWVEARRPAASSA